ncbi:hypothetical protein [Rummeliibacillus stabekisii]|uniref:hypothetical protein n=1 Tax=Rummeliibacillus stabekisii TaxID=241244 RepID=UPI003722F710
MNPSLSNLSPFDVAVLLDKAIILNGMLVNGSPEEKARAKELWIPLEKEILLNINVDAMEMAKRELALDNEMVEINHFSLFEC